MTDKAIFRIFKQGSRTYFYSSIFFPDKIRDDVFRLYAFVRKADNYVDVLPQQKKEFYRFWKSYKQALKGRDRDDLVISSFVDLIKKKKFDPKWVTAFLSSMEMDLKKKTYKTLKETEKYMYGSAEVIGLFMSSIMALDKKAYVYARYLGKSMQYINFIRDIAEDLSYGRVYLPQKEIKKYGLKKLDNDHVRKYPEQFRQFINAQIRYYNQWQKTAEKGYTYIPRSYLIPIKTASDMYNWTGQQILRDPFVVYRKKVKPSVIRIISTLIKNIFII